MNNLHDQLASDPRYTDSFNREEFTEQGNLCFHFIRSAEVGKGYMETVTLSYITSKGRRSSIQFGDGDTFYGMPVFYSSEAVDEYINSVLSRVDERMFHLWDYMDDTDVTIAHIEYDDELTLTLESYSANLHNSIINRYFKVE